MLNPSQLGCWLEHTFQKAMWCENIQLAGKLCRLEALKLKKYIYISVKHYISKKIMWKNRFLVLMRQTGFTMILANKPIIT